MRYLDYKKTKARVNTSWGRVARWYDTAIQKEESYHKTVILPNLDRLCVVKKGERLLDLGCGNGFFSEHFARSGAHVVGVDLSKEFIVAAQERARIANLLIRYHTASADRLGMIASASIDIVLLILAIQNMENYSQVFVECSRVLKKNGRLAIVMNHPVFRIPKKTSWGWDMKARVQYRRIDSYLSEEKIVIQMHPGSRDREITTSFHRPLQSYMAALRKAGFCISNFEEWISPKQSTSGPRAPLENRARKEFPLFLFLEACKKC